MISVHAAGWKKDKTYQVIVGWGLVILSADEQSLIKLAMSHRAIAKVLLGICVGILIVSVDVDKSESTYVGRVSGVGLMT